MRLNHTLRVSILSCCAGLLASSCNEIAFHVPESPQGATGIPGLSAYDVWKEQVEKGLIKWPTTTVADYLAYLKGEQGDRGKDGLSAYESWKQLIATGNTPHPHNPTQKWPADRNTEADFWSFMTGRDGNTPYIGENGHWWIGSKDTGVESQGPQGEKGIDGLSAYDFWKKEVEAGRITWDNTQTDLNDFFRYLKGEQGEQGIQGIPGIDGIAGEKGKDGVAPHIGPNGHWWIGNTDSGMKAQGPQG